MTANRITNNVLTTGEVAAICKVSARTVSKWIDCGRLQGYKIPGSRDRRVTHEALEHFMRKHRLPVTELTAITGQGSLLIVDANAATAQILHDVMVQETKREVFVVNGVFEAGVLCERSRPSAIVVDCNIGVSEAAGLTAWLRSEKRSTRVVATCETLGSSDETILIGAGVGAIVRKPCTVRAILSALQNRMSPALPARAQ